MFKELNSIFFSCEEAAQEVQIQLCESVSLSDPKLNLKRQAKAGRERKRQAETGKAGSR